MSACILPASSWVAPARVLLWRCRAATLKAMNSTSSIALSGMNAALTQAGAAAHNIANQPTQGFKRQTVQVVAVPEGGIKASVATAPLAGHAPEADLVGLLQAKHGFMANLAVFKTQDRMVGALLDVKS